MSGKKQQGTPAVIVAPKWKVSQLCGIVRGEASRGWLTPGEARKIIKDGKREMVYKPPRGNARRGKS